MTDDHSNVVKMRRGTTIIANLETAPGVEVQSGMEGLMALWDREWSFLEFELWFRTRQQQRQQFIKRYVRMSRR